MGADRQAGIFIYFLEEVSRKPWTQMCENPSFQIDWGPPCPHISALGKFPLCTVLFMHLVFPTLLQLIVSHRLGDFSANITTTSDHRTQQCFLMMQSRQSEQVNLPDSVSPRISIRYKRQGFMFMLKSAFNASHKYLRLMLYFQLLFHRLDHTFLQVRLP